jgi:hypothetical protein
VGSISDCYLKFSLAEKKPGSPIGAAVVPTYKLNDGFTDNPMYPFSVTEPSTICISLYQVSVVFDSPALVLVVLRAIDGGVWTGWKVQCHLTP